MSITVGPILLQGTSLLLGVVCIEKLRGSMFNQLTNFLEQTLASTGLNSGEVMNSKEINPAPRSDLAPLSATAPGFPRWPPSSLPASLAERLPQYGHLVIIFTEHQQCQLTQDVQKSQMVCTRFLQHLLREDVLPIVYRMAVIFITSNNNSVMVASQRRRDGRNQGQVDGLEYFSQMITRDRITVNTGMMAFTVSP